MVRESGVTGLGGNPISRAFCGIGSGCSHVANNAATVEQNFGAVMPFGPNTDSFI